MNAPYFQHQHHQNRERRYPVLAFFDLLLGWSIGLSTLAIGVYALGRVITFFWPITLDWLRAVGL